MSDRDLYDALQKCERLAERLNGAEMAIYCLVDALNAARCPIGDNDCERPGSKCSIHRAAQLAFDAVSP